MQAHSHAGFLHAGGLCGRLIFMYTCINRQDYRGLGACSPKKLLELGAMQLLLMQFGTEAEP